jgi:hypothetical protein
VPLFELPGLRHAIRRLYFRTMRGTRTIAWFNGPFHEHADWVATGRMLGRKRTYRLLFFPGFFTPANIEEIVFGDPELAARVNSFALVVSEDEQATKRLAVAFELGEGRQAPADVEALRAQVLGRLRELNQDYREATRFIPPESVPTLEFYSAGTGPFAGHDIRLKRNYVQRRTG